MMEGAKKVETISTADLIPYARNARMHDDLQVSQIAASIREFGFNNPVLIDADNGIIAGHGRVMAAHKLGLHAVPCIRLGHLSEIQKKAYILADNKIALNSSWNDEMLKLEIEELKLENFDTDLLGWIQLPDVTAAPDYSILDGDMGDVDAMADDVKKAIQIEFAADEYPEAVELVKFWREQGASLGTMILNYLRDQKAVL
jgi:ParB-like chromosome segregation protein Spo0J